MRNLVLVAVIIAAAGCSSSPAANTPDAQAASLTLGGARPTTMQVPPTIAPGQTYPLILVLHGYGATGFLQQSYFELKPPPITGGAFVLAPDGMVDSFGHQFWNAGPECCDLGNTGVDDVAYLGGLIDEALAKFPIDKNRVFIVGHSNGAFMAYRMACERADVIAAIAGLAGANVSTEGSGCSPSKPVSVLHIHGNADMTVSYTGGSVAPGAAQFPGAVASVTQWAGYDGCTGPLVDGTPIDLVNDTLGAETTPSLANCSAAASGVGVELWTMDGAGHIPSLQSTAGTLITTWLMAHPRASN